MTKNSKVAHCQRVPTCREEHRMLVTAAFAERFDVALKIADCKVKRSVGGGFFTLPEKR
jgi:hypothetical protein